MQKWLYIWIFCCWGTWASTQSYYHWKLTDEDGLPSMEIYGLCQDQNGYVWIGTDGGLCRFDGQGFKYYKHPKQEGIAVNNIQEDQNGRIWYKNFNSQLFFIDSLDKPQLFVVPDSISLNAYFVYRHFEGELRIITNQSYTYNFIKQTWTIDTIPNLPKTWTFSAVHDLKIKDTKDWIFINKKQELWVQQKEKAIHFGTIDSLKPNAYRVIPLNTNQVLIYGRNTAHVDNIHTACQLRDTALLLKDKNILAGQYINDIIWIQTRQGLYGFEQQKNGQWQKTYHLLKNEQISALTQDAEGNLWVGTLKNGIFIFPSLHIQYWNKENSILPSSQINCLAKDSEGQLLLGANKGRVTHFNPKAKTVMHSYQGKTANVTAIVFDEKRAQILFNANGLYTVDWKTSNSPSFFGTILGGHFLAVYQENQVLAGSFNGLKTYSLLGNKPAATKPDPKIFNNQFEHNLEYVEDGNYVYPVYVHWFEGEPRTTALWVDKVVGQQFWVGRGASLYCYHNMIPKTILTKNGEHIVVTDINQSSDGIIWVATIMDGIYGIENYAIKYHYTTKNGLPSNICKKLTTDGENLWIGTDKGIVRLNRNSEKIEVYNKLDGLVSEEVQDIAIAEGQVWVATPKGLVSFDKNLSSLNRKAPFIALKEVVVNDSSYAIHKNLSLLYNENNLKFTFHSTAIKARTHYVYEYRLLGLDSVWISQPSRTNFVRFQGLNPNKYVFEVRAKNEDGVQSQQIARFQFSIAPPYWQTWWFKSLVYLAGLLLAIGLISWRFVTIRKRQAVKNTINQLRMQALQSQMNPHFVFNAMSAIQSYWVHKQPKVALIYQAKFAKLMRLIFDYSKELTIHLEEEIEFLKIYISLEQMRFEDHVTVDFDVEEGLLEQEIYIAPLLIQPIIENSFKHGFLHKEEEGHLRITLKKEDNYIYCKIEDDGVGRAQAQEARSWQKHQANRRSSTAVVIERLTILNKTYELNPQKKLFKTTDLFSPEGSSMGTQTELWIPLK